MGLFSRKSAAGSPEEDFWQWFTANSGRLASVRTGREKICDELVRRLHKIHECLAFLFGPEKDGRREFIVSADGIKDAFPAVQKLVAAVPEMPGWNIIAFKPPMPDGVALQINGVTIATSDVFYEAEPQGALLGLTVHIRNADSCDDRTLGQITFLMLDSVLGEYDVATRIGQISWQKMTGDPAAMELLPLSQLPAHVNTLPSN